MKIIGKTLEGDLIIQVSQDEWDGIKPKEKKVGAFDLLNKCPSGELNAVRRAISYNHIDPSIESLRDIADGKISFVNVGKITRAKIKKLLDELNNEPRTTP